MDASKGASICGFWLTSASERRTEVRRGPLGSLARYAAAVPLAGKLLGATAIWITVAGFLVADTWRPALLLLAVHSDAYGIWDGATH